VCTEGIALHLMQTHLRCVAQRFPQCTLAGEVVPCPGSLGVRGTPRAKIHLAP
jgi:hypothetical protein